MAPGLIVYNRLLDAFLGKENEEGKREFSTSDFIIAKDLFIPKAYADKIVINNTDIYVTKENIIDIYNS